MRSKLRRILAIVAFLTGGFLLAWATAPANYRTVVVALNPANMQLKLDEQAENLAVLETRQARMTWPATMRIGDIYRIQMDFTPISTTLASSNQAAGFSDVYRRYNLMAEGAIEVAGVKLEPANPTRESMPSGQSVSFKWEIRAEKAGVYNGSAWLSLRFLPLDGSLPSQQPVWVQGITLTSTSLLGLGGPMARLVAGVVLLLGMILVSDDMINLIRRSKGKKTAQLINDNRDTNRL